MKDKAIFGYPLPFSGQNVRRVDRQECFRIFAPIGSGNACAGENELKAGMASGGNFAKIKSAGWSLERVRKLVAP